MSRHYKVTLSDPECGTQPPTAYTNLNLAELFRQWADDLEKCPHLDITGTIFYDGGGLRVISIETDEPGSEASTPHSKAAKGEAK